MSFGNSLFGQAKPAGSLFGATPTPAAGTGIFGQPAQNAGSAPAQTGSIFGQPQAQPAQQSSIFGQSAAPATGLFGQQQQAPQTNSLFGQPAQQPSIFGQSSTTPAQPSAGLFGQPASQMSSIFGQPAGQQQQQQQPQQNGSIFGASKPTTWGAPPAQAAPTSWNTNNSNMSTQPSMFGQQQNQQASAQAPLFTKSTKFNDLPDNLKNALQGIDTHIQGRVDVSKQLKQRKMGEEAVKGQDLIRQVHKELVNTTAVLRSDVVFTRELKAKADQAVHDTIVATQIIDGYRNQQQQGAYLKNHASFPLEFFTRITIQMRERLQWYQSTIEQIERKLSSSASQVQRTPQGISATLQAQHATFIGLASKTAALNAQLEEIRTLYTQLWRSKTGSMRDPFSDLDRGKGNAEEFGLGSIGPGRR